MESGRGKIIEEKSDDKTELSPDIIRELITNLGPEFYKAVLLKHVQLFDPYTLVALYAAYINNPPVRKLLAPYFLKSLEACPPNQLAKIIEGTRPISSDTYRAIEKAGKTTKYLEAYICYVFFTADVTQLNIEELNGMMNYLKINRRREHRIFTSLSVTLTALALSRERQKNEFEWPPSDINASNLCAIKKMPALTSETTILKPTSTDPTERIISAFNELKNLNGPIYFNPVRALRDYESKFSSDNLIKFFFYTSDTLIASQVGLYCNFSSLKLSNIYFDEPPEYLNFEKANLFNCQFELSNHAYSKTTTTIDLSECNLLNINFLEILPVMKKNQHDSENARTPTTSSHSLYLHRREREIFSSLLKQNELKIIIDDITLQSEELINLFASAEFMLTQPHPSNADLINFFMIKLSPGIETKEALIEELNKYNELEKTRSPNMQLANTPIRIMLLAAVIAELEKLAKLGTDIKPFYEAAFHHACFASPSLTKTLFKSDITDSQTILKKEYERIKTEIEHKNNKKIVPKK